MSDIQKNVIGHAQGDMAASPGMSHDKTSAPSQESGRPSSASVFWAAWRTGLKDLQNAVLNPFPPGHVAQHEEQGSIANPTQLEVYQEKHNEAPQADELSYLKMIDRASEQPKSQEKGRDR